MEITKEWIDQQRAVCNAATVAPWSWNGDVLTSHWTNVISVFDNEGGASFTLEIDESDRAFIAISRTALPAALDALEASMQREAEKDTTIARLTAERDAAARDLKWLSNEYKFCVTCKRDNGRGVWDCNDERCNAENHYEWRGLRSSNTDAPTGAESEEEHA